MRQAAGTPKFKEYPIEPFAPTGVAAIFSTAGFVFISYGGLLKVASIAEEVKDPRPAGKSSAKLSTQFPHAFISLDTNYRNYWLWVFIV
jgi:amino acid transporter